MALLGALYQLTLVVVLGCFTCGLGWLLYPIVLALRYKRAYTGLHPNLASTENFFDVSRVEETSAEGPVAGQGQPKKQRFSCIYTSPPTVDLTVVVPAYNEEKRLDRMMTSCLRLLLVRERTGFLFEIIIVNDASVDATATVAKRYVVQYGSDRVRVVNLETNRGKGGAVAAGVARARGRIILMADADGATTFDSLVSLEEAMHAVVTKTLASKGITEPKSSDIDRCLGVVIGSRARNKTRRDSYRYFLMQAFSQIVSTLCVSGLRDTQCGFKLFTREAAKALFYNLHVYRWAFDCELLYLATTGFQMTVAEVDVEWEEVEGSKIRVIPASFQMLRDLVLIPSCYKTGIWSLQHPNKP